MTEGKLIMRVEWVNAAGVEDVQTFIVKLWKEFKPEPGAIITSIKFIEVGFHAA